MKYKARCYIHFYPEGYDPMQYIFGEPILRPISHPVFESDTLRGAKRQATLYCKNHKELSKWFELDSTARWHELFRGILVRKTFSNSPVGANSKECRAIVEIMVNHKN